MVLLQNLNTRRKRNLQLNLSTFYIYLNYTSGGLSIMDRQKIKVDLLNIANEKLDLRVTDIAEEDNIIEKLGLDSLNITTLIIEIEEHFAFEFEEEDLMKISDTKSVLDIIEQKIN